MNPTGNLQFDHASGRHSLVLTRTFAASIEDAWASVTESERLARWFGTWTGDPASGSVMVTMNAEAEPVAPVRYDIHVCEPPRRLSVSAIDEYGSWRLTVELSETAGTTTMQLRQDDVDPASAHETGPGWEWYLDRLVGAVTEQPMPTLADFEAHYLALSSAYATKVADE